MLAAGSNARPGIGIRRMALTPGERCRESNPGYVGRGSRLGNVELYIRPWTYRNAERQWYGRSRWRVVPGWGNIRRSELN